MKPNQAKRKAKQKKKFNKPQPQAAAKPAADTQAAAPAKPAVAESAAGKPKTASKPKAGTAKPSAATGAAAAAAADKPHIAVRQPKPQPPAPLPQKPARQNALALFAALLCTALATIWFSQSSINAYWQQTHHRASPLERLNDYGWWRSGAVLQEAANRKYQAFRDGFEQRNQAWRQTEAAATAPAADDNAAAAASEPNVKPPSATVKPLEAAPAAPYKVRLSAGDKVFFAGDSMMDSIAPYLQRRLRSEYGIDSINLSRQSTGLSYPQFLDWPATIEQQLRDDPSIKLVVVFLGPNDPWDFPNPQQPHSRDYLKFQSPEWEQVYRSRIDRILRAAENARVDLMWLGIPLMKGNKLNTQLRYIDGLLADEVQGRAIWLPTAQLLGGGADGEYHDSITHNGELLRLRSKDGIHFTLKGQHFLADHVAERIEFAAPPASASAAASATP